MKRLEKEFLDKLEASQKIFERKTTMLDNNALTERIVLDKKKLLGLLKKDEIEAYFDEVDLMQNSIDDNMLKEVVLLQGRWTASENQRRLGVISPEDELLEKNKVRSGLIDISIRIKTVSKD